MKSYLIKLILLFIVLSLSMQEAYGGGDQHKNSKNAHDCIECPSDLVAWWPFNEKDEARILKDIIGGNQALPGDSIIGGKQAPQAIPGMVGGAIRFPKFPNGFSGARVSSSRELNWIGMDDFTIDAWVFFGPLPPPDQGWPFGPYAYIVHKYDTEKNLGYALYLVSPVRTGNERLEFRWGDGHTFSIVQSTNRITPDQWHHVAVTFERKVPEYDFLVRLYVDGIQQGIQKGNRPGGVGPILNYIYLEIAWGGSLDRPIILDELDFFYRALNPSEVRSIYQAGPAGKCKPQHLADNQKDDRVPEKIETMMNQYRNHQTVAISFDDIVKAFGVRRVPYYI